MSRMHTFALLAATAGVALVPPARAADPIDVVATFSILGDMVARVGGDRVAVTTLVGPNGDAHVYQPSPGDAQAILDADLVIVNGLGFEGFLDRLMSASGYTGPIVTAAAAIRPIEIDGDHEVGAAEHGDDDDDHAAEADGRDHGPLDPHAWQDVANGIAYVGAISEGLCGVDPEGCAAFEANAEAYRTELAALDADIRARIDAVPEDRRTIITSHDAFGYFARAYDVRFISPQGVSTDSEASARDVAELIEQIRETGVRVIFVESIADPRLIQRIAAETGAGVGGALFSDAL
ncbi:MAG TPA: zinc ABC transporter substrate-binding protein, partial [Methylomirabilota bacterium]|nr:zinc ABC transporter substrate-binding protein [Methylomirabilota bacterium]